MSDLIERDKAINILDRIDVDIIPYADTRECVQSAIDHIRKELEDIPSARPKGEWIKEHGVVNCSNCNHSHWSDCYEDTVVRFNFCPNCGCEMTKE